MSLLVWNCRKLGNQCTIKEFGELIQAKDPSVMFIAKTWTYKARLDQLQRNINFEHKWVVERSNWGYGRPLLIFL